MTAPDATRLAGFGVGDRRELSVEMTEELVEKFVALTGDTNPLHLSDEFAASVGMSRRVVHGMAYASFLSTLIGCELPGPGALWITQDLAWAAPVRIGDRLRIVGEVTHVSPGQRTLTLRTEARNSRDERVLSGTARVLVAGASAPAAPPVETGQRGSRVDQETRGRVAVVTGALGAVGRAVCEALAAQGTRVAVHFRSERARAVAFCQELAARYPDGTFVPLEAELAAAGSGARLAAAAAEQLGAPDIVVLNASPRPVAVDFDRLDWETHVREHLDVTVRSHLELIQAVAPLMKERRFGRVIGVLSNTIVAEPVPGLLPYVMAKTALQSMLKTAAVQYGPFGVTVNGIVPGMIPSAMTENISERQKEVVVRRTPTRRLTTAADVGALVAFLASPAAAQINGCMIPLDGGERMP